MPLPLPNAIQWSGWVVPNGGIDESKSDHELPPNKWISGFDVEPLPTGVRNRNGKTLVNPIAVGTSAITGILDYRTSDGLEERLLVALGQEVYKEEAGVLTAVSPGAGTFTDDDDVHPTMTVGSDIAFISNGNEFPKKFFIRSGVEYWANDGIAPPTATPTASVTLGGTLAVGTWSIDYYYWDDLLGIKSNTRYQGVVSLSVTTTSTNKTIVISGLPSSVSRAGDRVTHIRISLKNPNGGVFRFAGTAQGQVALGTTTATISADATTNEPDYDDDQAPVHSIAAVGSNQRFIAGLPGFPYRVMASRIGITGAFYESFPALNYRDFGKGDGDYVTAMTFIPPATLIVGMRNSVWALDARRFLTADPVLISKNVGIAGKNSLMVVGRTLFFVSDSDRTKGMMFWNGSQVIPLTGIDKTFKTLQPTTLRLASCAHLAPGDNRFQWWTMIGGNRVLVYDYVLEAWTIYRHSGNIIATAAKAGAIARVKIGGSTGDLYDADTGSDDEGTVITAEFTAKRDDFGSPDAPKRVRFLRAEAEGSSDSHINVQFQADTVGFAPFSAQLDLSDEDSSVLGSGVLGAFILGPSAPVISVRAGINGVCRNVQPKFSSPSRWHLRGYAIGAQVTRRRA